MSNIGTGWQRQKSLACVSSGRLCEQVEQATASALSEGSELILRVKVEDRKDTCHNI